tara:strand:+ start:402 stop:536 length:135 start_codon:yes stop_codon:yes gene_type:complete
MFEFIKYCLIIFGLWTGWNWIADNPKQVRKARNQVQKTVKKSMR